MECLDCNNPICDQCREHALPGVGYELHRDPKTDELLTLCAHCHADVHGTAPRCDHCQGTVVRGTCACLT